LTNIRYIITVQTGCKDIYRSVRVTNKYRKFPIHFSKSRRMRKYSHILLTTIPNLIIPRVIFTIIIIIMIVTKAKISSTKALNLLSPSAFCKIDISLNALQQTTVLLSYNLKEP